MGFDRLSNFIIKNFNYHYNFIVDDIKRKFLGNHVLFDLNFLIYNQMFVLEEEINTIIKIVLNVPFNYVNEITGTTADEKLQAIFDLPHWKKQCENIEYIFDGANEDDILSKLVFFINTKQENNLSKIDLMLVDKIINCIDTIINEYHIKKNIQTIGIFIDGIPSYSKILEQRRRRTKNYYESKLKKEKFDCYFSKINSIYVEDDNLKYNYFRWIEKRFSLDKSFSPISPIIKKLEIDLGLYFKKAYPNINTIVNPGSINGESDIKIFQFIQKNNLIGDIAIHTIDSDLIHLMLVQQTYFLLKKVDANIAIIKHTSRDLKNNNSINYYDGPGMINCLMKMYNQITRIDVADYRLIYDFCLLLFFFGNDHLPASVQFGPELGIDYIFNILSYNKGYIVNLINDKININLDIFKNTLINLNKNTSSIIAKILIVRNFKLPTNITNMLTDFDKLNFDYDKVIELLKNILIRDGLLIKESLDNTDIRYILMNTSDYTIDKYTEHQLTLINSISESILDALDFNDIENNGLSLYTKSYIKTKDNYQDLYNILSETTITELNQKNKVLYEPTKDDYLEQLKVPYDIKCCYSYIKKLYHLTTSFFGNLNDYHTNNITSFGYNNIPNLEHLIKYLNENNDLNKWNDDIKEENLNEVEYFNSVNHHIFITPYLAIDNIKNDNVKQITALLNTDNLWINNKNIDDFQHNSVQVKEFLTEWDSASYAVSETASFIIEKKDELY